LGSSLQEKRVVAEKKASVISFETRCMVCFNISFESLFYEKTRKSKGCFISQ
jgi:hypothetical protein